MSAMQRKERSDTPKIIVKVELELPDVLIPTHSRDPSVSRHRGRVIFVAFYAVAFRGRCRPVYNAHSGFRYPFRRDIDARRQWVQREESLRELDGPWL